ncbi:MAG: hypothetical protein FJ358_02975 [Thaumarchaeota archaeon]|nr:hypothetical protein [Nitrososphaerota archaeon]
MARIQNLRVAGEVAAALFFRLSLYAVVLLFLLQAVGGMVSYEFLAFTTMIIVLAHEALHILGMELVKADHFESFHILAINYGAFNLKSSKASVPLLLPYLALFPLGYWLTLTGVGTYVAAGWAIILMHLILLPIEAFSSKFSK